MKKMKTGAAAAASLAALIAAGTAAQAQAWIELRSGPRIYNEAPFDDYRDAPRYGVREALPRRAVRSIVEARGLEVIGPMQLNGDVYIVPVEDRRGRVRQVIVDARTGEFVRRGAEAPPRPPAAIGRYRDRYAAAPSASDLPPLPLDPRGGLREDFGAPVPPPAVNERERAARERYARQFPDGAQAPGRRLDDFDVVPGLAAPQAEPKKAAPQKRATPKKQDKPKQQAARTPPAAAAKASPKPEAANPAEAAKPEPPKEAAKPAPEATKPAPETAAAPAARPAAPEPEQKSNASVLRRPAQKPDAAGERKGVAEGPTISSGAEPQRKSPRVVYPGPGAPAPAQQTDSQ